MITINKTPNADSRSANEEMTVESLRESTFQHIDHVRQALLYFHNKLLEAAEKHDETKPLTIEDFYEALTSGNVKNSTWYQYHITEERHHLLSKAPDDVNLIDVIEYLCDCVMAGLARSGDIYDIELPDELLQKAFKNTVDLLKSQVEVVDAEVE